MPAEPRAPRLVGYTGGTLLVCAFINGGGHNNASNQFLAGLGGRPNLAEPRLIDLGTIPGNQCFVFDPACEPDADGDGTPDCVDGYPDDPAKSAPGACGCGVSDADTDGDDVPECNDGCPNDSAKTAPGACGCGIADTDTDCDGTPDCVDGCPNDPAKTAPGACGCGVSDADTDGDGVADCIDNCAAVANPNQLDCDADGALDACEIAANPALDCDLDGALDACELAAEPTLDCDENGRIDSCDVAAGAEDENGNDVPDTCEFAIGDLDLDGTVGAADLSVLLSFWGFPNPPVGDLDGNGVVGGGDLSVLLSNWGPVDL